MTKRNDIRLAIQDNFKSFSDGYFTYTNVNVKDYDIAGYNRANQFPIINIIALEEENLGNDNIGTLDNQLKVIIEGIPFANEIEGQEEIDKIIEDVKQIILSDAQLKNNAIDTRYISSKVYALNTDIPALTVKIEFAVSYREIRPLYNQ